MWRNIKTILLTILVLSAAVFGFLAVDQGLVPPRGEVRIGAVATVIGLLLGLGVARWRRIDWGRLALRLHTWRSRAAYTATWVVLAGVSIVVLIYY